MHAERDPTSVSSQLRQARSSPLVPGIVLTVWQEAHFNKVHYLCPHATCLGQKFVVFETELDLQAHSVSVHNTALSGDQRARKEARRIETNFTYEEERNVRGGGSGGAGFGGAGPSSTPRGGRSGDTTPEVREVGRRAVPGLGPPASTATATTTRSRRKAAATTLTPEEPAVASTSADPVILACVVHLPSSSY